MHKFESSKEKDERIRTQLLDMVSNCESERKKEKGKKKKILKIKKIKKRKRKKRKSQLSRKHKTFVKKNWL